jgi:hypothetical protein
MAVGVMLTKRLLLSFAIKTVNSLDVSQLVEGGTIF